jgi:peptidoglycan-associated lipoprotein
MILIFKPNFNQQINRRKNMKTNKMIYALALALVVTLASTGCRHKPVGLTTLHAGAPSPAHDENAFNTKPADLGDTGATGSATTGGGIATADAGLFEGMVPDRAALAAYTIHFAFDSAVIRSGEQASLQSVAQALAADSSAKLLIEGNCDERGTEEYNRSLGERRALAAREALAKLGVDPMRIRTESFGKDKPADTGHDEAAWQKNRRDDFVLLHPKAGA